MGIRPPRRFQSPKAGNRTDECEDISMIAYPAGEGLARVALCDGASESAFAREWASILAHSFVRNTIDLRTLDELSLSEWLECCEDDWHAVVPWDRIPWHGEAKTRAGALSTLLGVTLSLGSAPTGNIRWRGLAVGDSCLFVIRDDALWLSFPLDRPEQFGNSPSLICSNVNRNGSLWERVDLHEGTCLPGDLLMFASDALALWMLQKNQSGGKPWEELLRLNSEAQWANWVEAQRNDRTLKNDDTTLVYLRVT